MCESYVRMMMEANEEPSPMLFEDTGCRAGSAVILNVGMNTLGRLRDRAQHLLVPPHMTVEGLDMHTGRQSQVRKGDDVSAFDVFIVERKENWTATKLNACQGVKPFSFEGVEFYAPGSEACRNFMDPSLSAPTSAVSPSASVHPTHAPQAGELSAAAIMGIVLGAVFFLVTVLAAAAK